MTFKVSDYILEPKRNKQKEFFINLFELCNLNCSFCWQNHSDKTGIYNIQSKSEVVIKKLENIGSDIKTVDLNIMGGELFFDAIEDKTFEDYFIFSLKIQNYAVSKGININYNWVTNLVYQNTRRVKNLLVKLREHGLYTYLTTSYDPVGRFSKTNLSLFLKNLYELKGEIKIITVVLTKPTLNKLLNGEDRNLVKIYNNFKIFFDYYSPEKNHKIMAVTDEDLLNFFKFALKYFPDSYPLKDWTQSRQNKMTCRSSNVITPSGEIGKCKILQKTSEEEFFNTTRAIKSNSDIEEKFLKKYNCIECEYFQRCSLGCFLQEDYKDYNKLNTCMMKSIFEHIEGKEHAK